MSDKVSDMIVRGSDGSIDVDASREKFNSVLQEIISQDASSGQVFLGMFNEFFDRTNDFVTKSALVDSMASKFCGDDITKFSSAQKSINKWLTANTSNKREDGKIFAYKPGVKGGINRWSNIKDK
jgi:hypothetical protein